VNLNTVSGDDMGLGVLQTKKKHVHVVGFLTTYVRDYNNVYMFSV